MFKDLSIKFSPKFLDSEKDFPFYAHDGDSGFDVRADVEDKIQVLPGQTRLVPTGIFLNIPEGFEVQVRSRSGLALKQGLVIANSPGTIDATYRGECSCIVHNLSSETRTITKGDRIAQFVMAPVVFAEFVRVNDLGDTERNSGGFGSSGVK